MQREQEVGPLVLGHDGGALISGLVSFEETGQR